MILTKISMHSCSYVDNFMISRIEVEDAETDVESPDYKRKYRFNSENIVALPMEGDKLPKFSIGNWVLALYPDTSCFYRAKIVEVFDNVFFPSTSCSLTFPLRAKVMRSCLKKTITKRERSWQIISSKNPRLYNHPSISVFYEIGFGFGI